MTPSPEGCVLVKLRHESDQGGGHVLGWFRLEAIDGLPAMLQRHPLYFTEGENPKGTDEVVDMQLIAENGSVWVEMVFGSARDED